VAETTQDERKRKPTEQGQEPEASQDEREPEAKDEEQPEAKDEEQREARGEKEPDEAEEEREDEPPDLPEPEEKSADELLGQQVVDPHGYTIGKIEALFLHGQDERACWAQVKTGLIRSDSVLVPLHDAQQDGDQIRVVYEKEHVNAAPEIEPDGNELSDEQADELHGHYGLGRVKGLTAEASDEDTKLPRETRDANPPTMKERPWAVEKYPLPDMERSEGEESPRAEGEESSRAESSGEDSSEAESSDEDSEQRSND
jgi:hypothetical protein